MKLALKHKRLWMEKCSDAIFPHDEIKEHVETQKQVVKDAYDDFYNEVVAKHESDDIMSCVMLRKAEFVSFVLYSSDSEPEDGIWSAISTHPYHTQSSYATSGYTRVQRMGRIPDWGLDWVISNSNQDRKTGYLGSKKNGELQLHITDEQSKQFQQAKKKIHEIYDIHTHRMIKISQILDSCTTHKQLLEKAPGIYSNMPAEVKELHQRAAQRKMRANNEPKQEVKPKQEPKTDVDVPEDLDSELAVAAFISQ